MNETIAQLLIKIGVDAEEAEKASKKFDDTKEAGVAAAKETKKEFSKLEKTLSGLGTVAKGVGSAFAGLAKGLAAGTAAAVATIPTLIVEQTHLAKAAGVTVQEFERLSHAASQNGVEAQDLKQGILDLRMGLDDVATGAGGNAAEGLKRLGISLRDIQGLSAEDQFGIIADALNKVEDAGERGSLAMRVFGEDGGPKLMTLLSQGSEGIKRLGDSATHIDLADRLQIEEATKSFHAFMNQGVAILADVIVPLFPAIKQVGEVLSTLIQTLQESGVFKTLGDVLAKVGEVAADLAPKLGEIIGMLLSSGAIEQLLETVTILSDGLLTMLDDLMPSLKQIIELLPLILEIVNKLLPPLINIIVPAFELILSLLGPILAGLEPILHVVEKISEVVAVLVDGFASLVKGVSGFVSETLGLEQVTEWVSGLSGYFDNATSSALGLSNVLNGVFANLETRGKAAFEAVFGQTTATSPVVAVPSFQAEQAKKKNEVYKIMQTARNERRNLTDSERDQINAILIEGRLGTLGTQEFDKEKKAGKGKKKDTSEIELSEAILAIRQGQNDPKGLALLAKQLSAKTPSTKDIKPTVAIDFYNLQVTQNIKGSTDAKANQDGAMAAASKYFKTATAKAGQSLATNLVR